MFLYVEMFAVPRNTSMVLVWLSLYSYPTEAPFYLEKIDMII